MNNQNTFTNGQNEFAALRAMQNYIITTSDKLKQNGDYKKIAKIIHKLIEGGTTFVGKGYCISMSDIVYTLLKQNNIPCKIVECHLALTNKVKDEVYSVGFDGLKDDPNRADTHVVVVTETEIPMVIDVSIAHLLPNNIQGVVDELVDDEHGIFANVITPLVSLTYQKKKSFTVPMLHQRSILDRIQTDLTIFKSLKYLKYLIFGAILVSMLNASRGFYDFYQVYIDESNNWGPTALMRINKKIDSLESKLNQLEKK